MAQTSNYGLYVVGASEDPTVRDWVNKISGESDSNMTKIDEALVAMNSKVADIPKDVQEISSIGTIYDSVSALPTLTATESGVRYCAFTDGVLPIVLYEWDGSTLTWKKIDLVRGSSLYIVKDENVIYRASETAPYFITVGEKQKDFIETDPTVPAWAKAAEKPSYSADEVGALPATTTIPSKLSELENDTSFVEAEYVDNLIGNINSILDEINGEVV